TIDFFVKELQKVVKKYISKKNHFFMEVKAGIDERYNFPVGKYHNGYFMMDSNFMRKTKILFENNLLSLTEWKTINEIKNKYDPNKLDFEILRKLLRNHNTIRWTANEVLQGYKFLPGNIKITLRYAASQKTKMNLEV